MLKTLLDLDYLLTSWLRQLQAAHKSPHTIAGYSGAVRGFLAFCAATGRPAELTRDNVIEYMAAHTGQVSTARLHLSVLKIFAKWLAAEEGLDAAGVLGVTPPRADQRPVPHLTDHEIARMLAACDGTELRDRRDRALLALFAETGLRAAEMLALDVDNVDLDHYTVLVVRGKGGKGRRVRFSVGTAAVLDRYLRARHRAGMPLRSGPLWTGSGRGRLTYRGLSYSLKARAAAAGVDRFHPHRLRHSAAVRWLRAGGSETGLRAHAGWSSNVMVQRYTQAASEQLAAQEFDRLDLDVAEL
jgi:site-specific recombinase XerD